MKSHGFYFWYCCGVSVFCLAMSVRWTILGESIWLIMLPFFGASLAAWAAIDDYRS